MKTFILSEADIQSIINGRDVIKQDGDSKILIRQSYAKDILTPIIEDRFVVSDSKFDNLLIRTTNNNVINPLFKELLWLWPVWYLKWSNWQDLEILTRLINKYLTNTGNRVIMF